MATDLEVLSVRLEAQLRSFEREMARGRAVTNRELKAIEDRFRTTNKRVASSLLEMSNQLKRGIGAIGIGLGGRELQQLADEHTSIQNALRVTGLEGEALAKVYERLFQSAQDNAAPLQSMAQLYSRVALSQKELKISTDELNSFVDRVGIALRVSGKTAEQSSGSLLQLSQALGSGVVRAEEFNSMLEGTPTIVQAAANGIKEAGGSVAKLRQLVNDGKVSSAAWFRGFLVGSEETKRQAQGMETTVSQAMTRLRNAMIDAFGKIDKSTGLSKDAADAFTQLGKAIRDVATVIENNKGSFRSFVSELRDLDSAATKAARWFGQVTGLKHLGPALGLSPEDVTNASKLERILNELVPLQEGLADAEKTAAATGLDIDKQRVDLIRQRIAFLKEEQAVLLAVQATNASAAVGANSTGKRPLISLKDHPVDGKGKPQKLDTFERALFNAQKRIEILSKETQLIDENAAAMDRARLVIELETAARQKNQAEGKKNIEVTAQQRVQIEAMADQMYRAAEAAERARRPLAEFAREGRRIEEGFQNFAVSGLRSFEDALVSLGDQSTTTAEKFKRMTASILSDLGRLLIRQNLTGPMASWMSGLFPGSGAAADPWSGLVPGRAGGGPVSAGMPYVVGESGRELFVPRNDGMIIPNHALKVASAPASGGTTSVSFSIDARGAQKGVGEEIVSALSSFVKSPVFEAGVSRANKRNKDAILKT